MRTRHADIDDDDPQRGRRCPKTRSRRRSQDFTASFRPTRSRRGSRRRDARAPRPVPVPKRPKKPCVRSERRMAGGAGATSCADERISKSILATKKITRAMELIAASRIVKAQGAGAGGGAVRERHHRGRAQPAGRGRRRRSPDARRTSRHRPGRCDPDRGRPRVVWCVQLAGDPRRRSRDCASTPSRAERYELFTVGRKAEGYFRFRNFADRSRARGLQRQSELRGRACTSPTRS